MKRITASLARARDIPPGVLTALRAGSITAAVGTSFMMFGWTNATAAAVIALSIGFVVGMFDAR